MGLLILIVLVALYVGFPAVMAVAALLPTGDHTGEPPAGFTEVTLTTRDDVQLAAWYAEPRSGAAIILLHGAGNDRADVRDHARLLHENGYGVLALNLRGHGDSAGRVNRLGWEGTLDIGAAVDYLQGRAEVQVIGGLGLSMGGEILLGAAAQYPAIQAIVADGATSRAVNDFRSLPLNRPLYRHLTTGVFTFMVGLFTGSSQPTPTLIESIQAAEETAFLFIAAGNVPDEIAFNTFFHESAPERSDLWVIPGTDHTSGLHVEPDAYAQRVITFFETALRPGEA